MQSATLSERLRSWLWVGAMVALACSTPDQGRSPAETSTASRDSRDETASRDRDEPISRGLVVRTLAVPPRESRLPSDALVASARGLMTDRGRQRSCGPYAIYTDVSDEELLATCTRLAPALDATYTGRFGVAPVGQPAEAIFLFSTLDQYRDFVRAQTQMPSGYAAHSDAARGYLALYTGERSRQEVIETLIHELAHLITRRALGGNLPPWLSEGLANGLGDTATADELHPIEGANGAEAEASRLLLGYEAGQVPSLARLLQKDSAEFDSGTLSYDYEQSAFLVRLLLSDPELTSRFRTFLRALAAGSVYTPELFYDHLGLGAAELDRRLEAWLRSVTADGK